MHREQSHQQRGDEQDVSDVEPRDDHLTRERPAEDSEGHVTADDWRGLHEPGHGADARAREQVIRQRVACEALDDGQQGQHGADDPVDLTRLAERAGEEDSGHVQGDAHDEEQSSPVVQLPDQQSTLDVEGDVERGGVGLTHAYALERHVRAAVFNLSHAWHIPERQERSGDEADEHRIHGHFTKQEGPVIGEDLAKQELHTFGAAHSFIAPDDRRSQSGFVAFFCRGLCSARGGVSANGVRSLRHSGC